MNRWKVVVGAVLIQLSLGAIYAWSVFPPALKAAGWSKLDTQVVFAVGLATFALVMVWAGRKLADWGPHRLAVTGGLVLAAGYGAAEASAIAGTAMAVFFSLANGVGRIVWGTLSDHLGRRLSVIIMTGTQGVVLMIFSIVAGNEYMLYLSATLIGFNFGGNFALFPTLTADTFGNTSVSRNYTFVFLSYGVGGIAGPIVGGLLGDMGDFPTAFGLCGLACLCGAFLAMMVSRPQSDDGRHRED